MQLRKTREGQANLIRDVDESLGEQPSPAAAMVAAGLNGGGDARTGHTKELI
jgi:hypothetical protein